MKYKIKRIRGLYSLLEKHKVLGSGTSLGINIINGNIVNDSFSFYDDSFDSSDVICVDNNNGSKRVLEVDKLDVVIDLLKRTISKNSDNKFVDLCASVQETINNYFGGFSHTDERLESYPTEDMVNSGKFTRCRLTSFQYKNIAYSFERSVLAQNLFRFLKLNSGIKFSMVKVRDEHEREYEIPHAYNVIENEGRYFLIDVTIPTINDEGRISPVIMELNEDEYQSLFYPLTSDDELLSKTIDCNHFDPLTYQYVTITYNFNNVKKDNIDEEKVLIR